MAAAFTLNDKHALRTERQEQLRRVLAGERQGRIAVMVYGSFARGTDDSGSDVDVLELVERDPKSYRDGQVNVTQYVPAHLHALAAQGSLFVLHLRTDGQVVEDPYDTLGRALRSYREPPTYEHVLKQLAVAAGALDPSATDFETYLTGLARLGIYILRTAAYIRAIELGHTTFDTHDVAQVVGGEALGEVLALRRQTTFTSTDVLTLRDEIARIVPGVLDNNLGSVVAYSVAHATRGDLASLFGAVLTGTSGIDYSAMTLPPF